MSSRLIFRTYIPLFALMAGGLLFVVSSCEKDEPTPLTTYSLSITKPIHGTVEVGSEKSTYQKGEQASLIASPAKGYAFSHWTGVPKASETQNPLNLTITANIAIEAVFVKTYTVDISVGTGGTVTNNELVYKHGDTTNIIAMGKKGYTFSRWVGANIPPSLTSRSPLRMEVTQDITFAAEFKKKATYTLKLSPTNNGSVIGNKDTYTEGETTEITAIANTGYYFSGWIGAKIPPSLTSRNPLRMEVTQDINLSAAFKEAQNLTHTLTLVSPKNGTVNGHKVSYKDGERTNISAIADRDYVFSYWAGVSDADRKANPLQVVMTQDIRLAAVFEAASSTATYSLILSTAPIIGGAISGGKATYAKDEKATLTPNPSTGYIFSHWSGIAGNRNANPLTLTMDGNKGATAHFVRNTYTLKLTPPTHGSVSGNKDTYKHGDMTHITATADKDYAFSHWTGVGNGNKTDNPLNIAMTNNTNLTAVFVRLYTLTLTPPNNGAISQNPNNKTTFKSGESLQLNATANDRYVFDKWTGDIIATDESKNPLTITMDDNKTITAAFKKAPIYLDANGITLKADPATQGGETHTYNGKTYTIAADKAALVAAIRAGKDMSLYITTKVTDMSALFKDKHRFDDDISSWDVSQVIHMRDMFSGANAFNQDISKWNVGQVIDMNSMFSQAFAFNQDIGQWNVSRVTNMGYMFFKAIVFNQDLSNWCVSKIKESGAFDRAASSWKKAQPKWGKCP